MANTAFKVSTLSAASVDPGRAQVNWWVQVTIRELAWEV